MKNIACFLSLLLGVVCSCAAYVPFNDELLLRTRVNVNPSKEKVMEDDPAIFICDVSSLDSSAHVTWYRSGKPLDLDDANVSVVTREREQSREDGVYHIVSVLRIERTSKRRHKGRYACHVTTDSDPDDTTTATALLIVMKVRGSADLQFGQLPPEQTLVDPATPIAYRPNVDMTCTAYFKDEEVTDVFWMKNRTYEVSETRAFKSGRLMVGTLGSMIIRRPEPSDSGVYECVAQRNKHLIISRPVHIFVHERVVRKNCTDQNGTVVPIGAEYHPYESDYCTICMCSEDPYRMSCSSTGCPMPRCANYEHINGTCCGYKCPGDDGDMTDGMQTGCKDRNGKMVEVGQLYHPDKDPCTVCECIADPNSVSCSNEACAEPTCANYTVQADTCCGYICLDVGDGMQTGCKDRDGKMVEVGQLYHPDKDPCTVCECMADPNSMPCSNEACAEPTCANYTVQADTCCGYICLDVGVELDVRQVGPRAALVLWRLPNSMSPLKNVVIKYMDSSGAASLSANTVHVTNGNRYAWLQDLDPNVRYTVSMAGTSPAEVSEVVDAVIGVETGFSLDGRRGTSMKLTPEKHSEVMLVTPSNSGFNSPVPVAETTFINMDNFDAVMDGQFACEQLVVCPALKFYRYGSGNSEIPVLVVRFYQIQDFFWARAHL